MGYKIITNKIKCKKCGDEIESTYRHDFKMCSCESVAVDGGKDYLRRIGETDDIDELSTVEVPLRNIENSIVDGLIAENKTFSLEIESYRKKLEKIKSTHEEVVHLLESYIENEGWIEGSYLDGTNKIKIDANGITALKDILDKMKKD